MVIIYQGAIEKYWNVNRFHIAIHALLTSLQSKGSLDSKTCINLSSNVRLSFLKVSSKREDFLVFCFIS